MHIVAMVIELLTEFGKLIETQAAPKLVELLGGSESALGGIVSAHPIICMVALSLIPAIIIICIAVFTDFIADAWKMPFAIVADVLAFYAYIHPGLMTAVAIGVSAVLMIFLNRDIEHMKWFFAILTSGEILVTAIPGVPAWIVALAGLLAFNTILFFIAAIID